MRANTIRVGLNGEDQSRTSMETMALLALDMKRHCSELSKFFNTAVRLKIGLCSGSVVAGVIGYHKLQFDGNIRPLCVCVFVC